MQAYLKASWGKEWIWLIMQSGKSAVFSYCWLCWVRYTAQWDSSKSKTTSVWGELDTWKYWKVLFCQSNNCLILTDDDADEKIAWDRATWCIQTCPNIQLDWDVWKPGIPGNFTVGFYQIAFKNSVFSILLAMLAQCNSCLQCLHNVTGSNFTRWLWNNLFVWGIEPKSSETLLLF